MAIADDLQVVLANTYFLYLKTQNYHWNVAGGPYFKTLHELFETHYLELGPAIDEIAERIRQLGETVPATFADFSKHTRIKEGQASKNAQEMLADLLADQKIMLMLLKEIWQKADTAKDEITADLLIERMEAHGKVAWFYSSSLD